MKWWFSLSLSNSKYSKYPPCLAASIAPKQTAGLRWRCPNPAFPDTARAKRTSPWGSNARWRASPKQPKQPTKSSVGRRCCNLRPHTKREDYTAQRTPVPRAGVRRRAGRRDARPPSPPSSTRSPRPPRGPWWPSSSRERAALLDRRPTPLWAALCNKHLPVALSVVMVTWRFFVVAK